MRGIVEQITKSKTGKSWRVMIASQWYGAKFDSKLDQAVGKRVDFSIESNSKYGDWIKDWDFDRDPAPIPMPVPSADLRAMNAQNAKGDRWWLNFTSNIVAHSIAAGLIKEPIQLAAWAKAAKHAIEVADGAEAF